VTTTTPHQALYRRWRAQTFSQIVGQEAVVETLRNAVRTDRVSHAILFVGPRGTGKTSLARIVAKAVNCTNLQDGDPCDTCDACVAIREGTTLDVLEIDAASNRGINEVRDLRDRLAYPPGHLRRKVYILDEAHQITRDAWNALLKSIEEPPEFVMFIFASTEPSGFPPAILSRLQRYDVRRLTVPEIEGKLTKILEADGRTIDPAALTMIARLAAGGMRDAESILDQLLSMTSDTVTEAAVRDLLGMADAAAVDGFRGGTPHRRCRRRHHHPRRTRGSRPGPTRAPRSGRRCRPGEVGRPHDRGASLVRRHRPPARRDRSGSGEHRRSPTPARARALHGPRR
jgi:DNA polymerase-3 subunit gamma/tau